MIKKIVLLVLLAVLHFCATFLCWSFAPGNAAVETSDTISIFWKILSFPLVAFLPGVFNSVGMPILFINSCLWVFLVFFFILWYKQKKAQGLH